MSLNNQFDGVQNMLLALIEAAKHGASVTMLVDAYAFMMPASIIPGPLLLTSTLRSRTTTIFQKRLAVLDQLAEAGAVVVITNRPQHAWSLPFAGRSHMKFAVLNEDVFIGGCNLTNPAQLDLMILRRNDRPLAQQLRDLVDQIQSAPDNSVMAALKGQDVMIRLDDDTKLLIDAGTPGRSSIESLAHKFTDKTLRRLLVTCQYPVSGTLLRLLLKAKSRHESVLITNPLSRHPLVRYPFLLPVYINSKMRLGDAQCYPIDNRYLHAKIIIADDTMIIGSHNFVRHGVRFGTAEIALLSTSPKLINEVWHFIREQIAN